MKQERRAQILRALGKAKHTERAAPSRPSPPPRPQYAFTSTDLKALFIEQAEKQHARPLYVVNATDALALITDGQPEKAKSAARAIPIYITPHSPLAKLRWQQAGFTPRPYEKQLGMVYGASLASAAIAETGTLIVPAASTSARGVNFFIDHHIVFVAAKQIFFLFEDYWQVSSAHSIHFITGPSRTADIEQELHLGAHGPKILQIVIYDHLR